ncbi:MAG: ATP-binding protein [Pseudorhodoplanes sp.]
MNSVTHSPFWITRPALGGLLLVAFVGLEWLSSIHEFMSVPITPWNPGLGLVFAFMLLSGPVYALVLFAGVILAELVVLRTDLHWPIIVALAAIISLVYGAAAIVTRRNLRLDAGLYHVRDLFVLLTSGTLAALVTALLVALVLLLDHRIELGNVRVAATPLLLGDAIGIAVMTPLTLRLVMLLQGRASLSGYSRHLTAEVAFYSALCCVALWVVFGSEWPGGLKYFYLMFVPVVLAAVRHGFDGACISLAVTQFALVWLMHRFGYDAQAFTEMQTLMLVLTGTGLVVGAVVSERKQTAELIQIAEDRLREKETEAAQAARFSLVSGMATALAHEINQPMTAARALARSVQHLLENPSPDLPRAKGNIANVIAQIDHAGGVVRRMRDFLRRGGPHVSTFEVKTMLEDTLALARPDANARGIDLVLTADGKLPPAHGDRIQLQQVLLNLIRNATEAIAAVSQPHGRIEIAALALPTSIEFSVHDNGPGIAPAIASRLFEPLTTSRQEGLGLGLSISQGIVESHGGRIWLHLREPGTTEFRFTLPLEKTPD